jgi:hypothetical protein
MYDTRKVQADLFSVITTYGYFSEDHAANIITDIRTFMDNKVISAIKFTWKEAGTKKVIEEIRYNVVSGGVTLADDKPGGIRYQPALADADFTTYVTYNDRWTTRGEAEKQVVRDDLVLSWGPSGTLDYSKGSWRDPDKSYSNDGTDGLSRQRFTQ